MARATSFCSFALFCGCSFLSSLFISPTSKLPNLTLSISIKTTAKNKSVPPNYKTFLSIFASPILSCLTQSSPYLISLSSYPLSTAPSTLLSLTPLQIFDNVTTSPTSSPWLWLCFQPSLSFHSKPPVSCSSSSETHWKKTFTPVTPTFLSFLKPDAISCLSFTWWSTHSSCSSHCTLEDWFSCMDGTCLCSDGSKWGFMTKPTWISCSVFKSWSFALPPTTSFGTFSMAPATWASASLSSCSPAASWHSARCQSSTWQKRKCSNNFTVTLRLWKKASKLKTLSLNSFTTW